MNSQVSVQEQETCALPTRSRLPVDDGDDGGSIEGRGGGVVPLRVESVQAIPLFKCYESWCLQKVLNWPNVVLGTLKPFHYLNVMTFLFCLKSLKTGLTDNKRAFALLITE